MPRRKQDLLASLSVAELKSLLANKKKIDALQTQKAAMEKKLDRIEKELAKVIAGATGTPARRKKRAKKKVAKKARKKRVAKKVAAKPAVKKTRMKRVVKKTARKTTAKKKTATKPRATVESVVINLLKKRSKPMAFQDILSTIQKKKLVKTKSKDFANVLRRTLSTSKKVKRAGRGVYNI